MAGLIAAAITAIVWGHLWASAPQPYGVHGDEYVEHAQRLTLVLALHQGAWRSPLEFLRLADMDYPPGIHALGLPLGALFGHAAERIGWAWMGWVALLGLALAWIVDSLGGDARGRAAAFASAFLIPAVPAAATRYHFDLPMLVLCWWAFACALGSWSQPALRTRLLGGALTGALAAAAAVTKWTAIPFLLCMLGAASVAPDGAWTRAFRRRAPAVVSAAAVAGGLLTGFFAVTTESIDAMSMTFTLGQDLPAGVSGLVDALPAPLGRAVSRVALQAPFLGDWLAFYGLSTLYMVLSPVLAVGAAILALRWLAVDRRGLVPFGLLTVGGLAFLTLNVPIADSRFILPLAPLAGLVAVLGWTTLGPRTATAVAAIVTAAGLAVAADFHLNPGPARQATIVWERPLADQGGSVTRSGLGLASSSKDRGWVRRDEELPHRRAFRQALWDTWLRCGGGLTGVSTSLISFGADRYWWQYKARLDRVEGRADGGDPWPQITEVCELENPDAETPSVLFVRAASAPDRRLPDCAAARPVDWRWAGFVADPDGGAGAAIHVAPGTSCETR